MDLNDINLNKEISEVTSQDEISENAEAQAEEYSGILYIISTPIGNDDDISLRALKSIRGSHLIVCEEGKEGSRFLHKHKITQKMDLLNENNEVEKTYELLEKLKNGMRIALISDCGTPVFADPGLLLVQECIKNDIKIVAVPGASSIMTALVTSGFPINSFLYAGFMSREKSLRLQQIGELAYNPHTVVLLETPYRLMPLLEAFVKVIPQRRAFIACNLTLPYETRHYGTFSELYDKFSEAKFKGEFVIVFEGNSDSSTILVPEGSSVENESPKREGHKRKAPAAKGRRGTRSDFSPRGRDAFSGRGNSNGKGRFSGRDNFSGRDKREGGKRDDFKRKDRRSDRPSRKFKND